MHLLRSSRQKKKSKWKLIYQCSDVLLIQTVCKGASELQVTEVKPVGFYREGRVRELSSNEDDSAKAIPRR